MSRNRIVLALALASAGAFALPARADDETEVWVDEVSDFTAFKTWAWGVGTPSVNAEMEAAIRADVEKALAARGLVPAGEGEPDLYVLTHVTRAKERGSKQKEGGGSKFEGEFRGGSSGFSLGKIPVGSLAIEVLDNQRKVMVWRGYAKGRLETDAEAMKQRVAHAVEKLFDGFPRKAEK